MASPDPAALLAEALDGVLPRMAFVRYGQFYNDDPDFDLEAYYLRAADAALRLLPPGWCGHEERWHADGDECPGVSCLNPEHGWTDYDRSRAVEAAARAVAEAANLVIEKNYAPQEYYDRIRWMHMEDAINVWREAQRAALKPAP